MASLYKSPRVVTLGGENGIRKILVGGNNPVTIQTMWKEGITDVAEGSEKLTSILKEINNLPSPQRNRVYLKIIKDYKNAEIANCENVDKSAVTRSLKVGIEKIFKKYKKF